MNEVVVVNENDEIVGTMLRSEAHTNGTPHRIAVVYVENDANEILVQTRISGRYDHSSAGHVDPGESYLQTAARELEEELGIKNVSLISIGYGRSEEIAQTERGENKTEHRVHIFEVFVCKAQPGVLSPEEVKSVYWATPQSVLEEMNSNPNQFTNSFTISLPIYINWKSQQ
jgi:isopentenyldiphosphate isomerase